MKYRITLRYPSGYRLRREVEADTLEEARRIAEELAWAKDKHFFPRYMTGPIPRVVKIESVTEIAPPPTIYGYPVADLEFAAALLREAELTPDDLRKCIDNIEYVVELVQNDMRKAMDRVGAEYARKMLKGCPPNV